MKITAIGIANQAGGLLASVFGDGMTALHVGPSFSCSEAETIAKALILLGQDEAAVTFLSGHGTEDDVTEEDSHVGLDEDGAEQLVADLKAELA